MLTCHELLGFMSPELATEIISTTFEGDKELYKATLNSVAEARKVRTIFLQRQPKEKRNQTILQTLARPNMEMVAGSLLRGWLVKSHQSMLENFLTALGIEHNEGMVEELPESVETEKLKAAVEKILEDNTPETVAVYLHTFNSMNDTRWENLDEILGEDERLQVA